MIDIQPLVVIVDGGLHSVLKLAIQQKYAHSGATVIELSTARPALEQLQALLPAHAGSTEIQVFAQLTRSPWEDFDLIAGRKLPQIPSVSFSLGSTVYETAKALRAQVQDTLGNTEITLRTDAFWNGNYQFIEGATSRNDFFESAGGKNEVFVGLDGVDTVSFSSSSSAYSWLPPNPKPHTMAGISYLGGGSVSGIGGHHSLFNIERLQFSDRNVALDLADGESANTALRLLTAVVGKQALANQALVGEIIAYTDRFDLGTLAQVLIDTGVMAQLAGGHSNAQLIQHLYSNIAGQGPSQAELQWTLDFVASNGFTQTDILEAMVGLPQTGAQAQLIAQAQVGVDYLPYELL